MKRIGSIFLAFSLLCIGTLGLWTLTGAQAQGLVAAQQIKKDVCDNSGVCSTATGLDSAQNTGWIPIEGFNQADLHITFTDANNSVTALNITCEEVEDNSTAAAAGWDICSADTGGGTSTYTCPHTFSLTTGTAEKYSITVSNLRMSYLNCLLTATGTPAAADTALVSVDLRVN